MTSNADWFPARVCATSRSSLAMRSRGMGPRRAAGRSWISAWLSTTAISPIVPFDTVSAPELRSPQLHDRSTLVSAATMAPDAAPPGFGESVQPAVLKTAALGHCGFESRPGHSAASLAIAGGRQIAAHRAADGELVEAMQIQPAVRR